MLCFTYQLTREAQILHGTQSARGLTWCANSGPKFHESLFRKRERERRRRKRGRRKGPGKERQRQKEKEEVEMKRKAEENMRDKKTTKRSKEIDKNKQKIHTVNEFFLYTCI